MEKFYVNPDIREAETLPAHFYKSEEVFDLMRERVFEMTWQWIGDKRNLLPLDNFAHPFQLLDGYLNEPLLLVRKENEELFCMSNVCTHRGNILVHTAGKTKHLICMYHGRRFDMEGNFKMMPEFNEAKNFPRKCEGLHRFSLNNWKGHLFTGLEPQFDITEMLKIMDQRIGFLPLTEFKFDASLSKDYLVNCHWALYCDNYLEGFHVPFVHMDLNKALDYGKYKTEIYGHMNLQIGYAEGAEEVFNLPAGHPDFGENIGAYYYWLFPNMMFNFYPWGLSVNIVKPMSLNKTKVSFLTYVYDESKLNSGAGALLDKVEREDEFVVEGVHRGIQSKYYETGRFSPSKEQGVHHFHGLLAKYMNA